MKAIRIHAPGGPEALQYDDVAEPTPGAGQAVVKLAAAGVNYIDVYFRTGANKAPLPLIIGLEGAGTVSAVGQGVTDVKAGDIVAWTGVQASYAQMTAVPANRLVKLPAGVAPKDGAAAMLQGMTAHYLVKSSYPLKKGDTCLVHAAVGATTFDKSLSCLRPRGFMVLFGAASGPVPLFDLQVLNVRGSLFLQRPSLNHHIAAREELVH